MAQRYTSFGTLAPGAVPLTAGLFIQSAGTVEVGGPNGDLVNLGSLAAGTQLDGWAITQVGTNTTATLIALR